MTAARAVAANFAHMADPDSSFLTFLFDNNLLSNGMYETALNIPTLLLGFHHFGANDASKMLSDFYNSVKIYENMMAMRAFSLKRELIELRQWIVKWLRIIDAAVRARQRARLEELQRLDDPMRYYEARKIVSGHVLIG